MNVEDAELLGVESANVGVRNNFSKVSERENVNEDDDEDEDDDDDDEEEECELSRLSNEMSLFDNETVVDGIFEQRFRTNGHRNDDESNKSISTKTKKIH